MKTLRVETSKGPFFVTEISLWGNVLILYHTATFFEVDVDVNEVTSITLEENTNLNPE